MTATQSHGTGAQSMLIGGQWVKSCSERTMPVLNPANEEPLPDVPDADVNDGLSALHAAAGAQSCWAATPPRQRTELLRAIHDAIVVRGDEFAATIAAETGKPWAEAKSEVEYGAGFFHWFSEAADRLHLEGQFGLEPGGQYRIAVSKRPVGPSLLITPWNFPLAMPTRKVAAALAAGCTTILKPAEQTPLTALLLAKVMDELGTPAGVLNVITTTRAPEVIAAIMNDGRARKVSFTGSTQVGKMLLRQAAVNVMNTSMELGGNGALIVFDDADLDRAVDDAIVAKFRNGGQSCVAANRLFVQSTIADEFVRRFVQRLPEILNCGGGQRQSELGPLIDDRQLAKVSALVDDAVGKGAKCVLGGHASDTVGYFYEPTVLRSIPGDADIRLEEIFGPVAPIYEFETEVEVVAAANATPYGLASYVFTRDLARAFRVADALDTGMTGINRAVISNPAAPFGGTKASGIGREGGEEGLHAYLETKYLGIQI